MPARFCAQPLGQAVRAAAHIQASGQNAFRSHAALHARLHGLPDSRCPPERALSARAKLPVAPGSSARSRAHSLASITRSMESECARATQAVLRRCETDTAAVSGSPEGLIGFSVLGDESAADGKEGALGEDAPAESKAVNRRPLGCCVCAPGGNIWSR
jgi:hypothetical protein